MKTSKTEKLTELLSKITPENRHAEIDLESPRAEIKIKRLHPDAVLPVKAHAHDAGYDLVAVEDTIIKPGATVLIKTGLAFELPPCYEMQIRPRSGVTLKTKLRVQLGTVDSNYRGEVGVICDNIAPIIYRTIKDEEGERYEPLYTKILYDLKNVFVPNINHEYIDGSYIIRKGDRIAQAVIQRLPDVELIEVEALGDSERGAAGYGSTGVTSE